MITAVVRTCRSLWWRSYLRWRGARVGRGLRVQGPLRILLRDGGSLRNVVIGDDVELGGSTYLRLRRNGRVVIGSGVRSGTEVWLVSANDAELRVGDNTAVGSYTILNGGHGLSIGSDCVLAAFAYVSSSDHASSRARKIREQGFVGAPIHIADDVWLGGHIYVGKGVTIGQGAVVGAGAVIVKDVPAYKVVVGNPGRVIRDRE